MNASLKYLLDFILSFCISIDNINNFYFNDNHHLKDILSVPEHL